MAEDNRHRTHITDSYGVQVGDNNKLYQEINYVLKQRYKGRDARLRRSLEHDLSMLKKHPKGPARNELIESIEEKTAKLAKRHRTQNRRRAIWTISILVVIVVVGAVSIVAIDNHAKIANGRPGYSWVKKWTVAVGAVFRGEHLSPRGNVMPKADELVELKARDPKTGDKILLGSFKLIRLDYVEKCTLGGTDKMTHSRNGQLIILEFEFTSHIEDTHDATLFSRDDFVAYDLEGNKFSIGDSSGEECIPGVVAKDGIKEISKDSTHRALVLADVPSNGYIAFSPNRGSWWPWEWGY
ncbi:hypothetical protein [Nocardia brasiliensis]|uniref:hypothetical protein n=1 Tax=Nocardia brasiliensis TaxID=37326 RepID=UPI00189343FD|nr:hypothetical protein [Nocardia brasiliensis]MBF6546961.1 hypothetical protein [Nocardia brasiliensis]